MDTTPPLSTTGASMASRTSPAVTTASDEYNIDDQLITDSVKKMLSSDTPHFDLPPILLGSGVSGGHSGGQMGGHSAPTVQEGMDLVDALDHLVQNLSRTDHSSGRQTPCDYQPTHPMDYPLTAGHSNLFDVVLMDHNYCHTYDYYVTPGVVGTGSAPPMPAVIDDNQPIIDDHQPVAVSRLSPPKKPIQTHSTTVPPGAPTTSNTNTTTSAVQNSSQYMSYNDNSYASTSTTMTATSPSPTRVPADSPVPTTPVGGGKGSPKTPPASRRSQRQIDRIEKTVLEKIKAENQEMLKREKELSLESPIKLKPIVDQPMDETVKDTDENQLIIDLDKKSKDKTTTNSNIIGKRNAKRQKSNTNESMTKKSRMDVKSERKTDDNNGAKPQVTSPAGPKPLAAVKPQESPVAGVETSEADQMIAALRDGGAGADDDDNDGNDQSMDDKLTQSARQQRTRRKPKRWDDDEVEVDFSGQLGILAENQLKPNDNIEADKDMDSTPTKRQLPDKPESVDGKRAKANDSQQSSANEDMDDNEEEEEDSGSDFDSEDDPEKLWCFCRQPHDNRFMIGCDACDEWFHGTCVNVTKQQGRVMEKEKREWLCPTCVKGIADGVPREELKRQADQKRAKLEAEARIRAQTKRMAKEKFLRREKSRENATKHRTATDRRRESDPANKRSAQKSGAKSPTKQSQAGSADKSGAAAAALLARKISQMPPKKRELHLRLEEESEKLKKLIKSSKKDLNKKMAKKSAKDGGERRRSDSTGSGVGGAGELESISKVVQIVRKPETKKKHKDAIDFSVQDLFKAEPIKKLSSSTAPTTPTTPGTPGVAQNTSFTRKPSVSDSRRQSVSITERHCPAGCGRTVTISTNIYCNQECIETHVSDMLKVLRTNRRERSESGTKIKDIDRRVVIVEKSSGRLLSGKDAIPEKEVLDYIKANPTYEVFRPSHLAAKDTSSAVKKKPDESPVKNSSPHKSNKKDDKQRTPSISRSNSRSGIDMDGSDQVRANVRTTLKDALVNRCNEANESLVTSADIQKTAQRIEEELFKAFNKDTTSKYRNKYRSLIFNLKDTKNQGLFRKVITGKIGPERLVQMSAEELASSELAKWREREKITMLEMIKRDAAEKVNQVIVKKTHKGEELIESNTVGDTTTNESKSDDNKAQTNTTPLSGASSLLDDLMGTSSVDTTSQHRTHLFSNNCRICMNKQSEDSIGKSDTNKSTNQSSNTRSGADKDPAPARPTPKRVRVDSESTNKILMEAAKLTSAATPPPPALKRTTSADEDDSHEQPTSTVSLSSPEVPSSSSASRPVWKGMIFMQDVAKFAAHAVKVSGAAPDYLIQDVNDTIAVCGRIAPEQVLDYVKKLKYSSRSEIGLVKFVSRKEDRIGYDAFFDYLNTRGRYGVVGGSGNLKDFYILPLPKHKDVPDVLLPFEGPGLDKKSIRPNLLLGIIIRSKKHTSSHGPSNSLSNLGRSRTGSDSAFRSYTPPPKSSSNDSSPDDNNNNSKDSEDVSYTPPRTASSSTSSSATAASTAKKSSATFKPVAVDDDDEPYDPEEADLTPTTTTTNQQSIPELMERVANSSNPVEMTSSVLAAIGGSTNLELQRRLLEQLTAKVDEQKRQLEIQKAEAEASSALFAGAAAGSSQSMIPGLDGEFASSLKDITIPDNLQDILSTVKHKTQEIERQQERLRAAAATGFKFDDPIVKKFGTKSGLSDSVEDSSEAMDLDEEVPQTKTTILEVNTPTLTGTTTTNSSASSSSGDTPAAAATTTTTSGAAAPSMTDPRLRSNKQKPLPSIQQETGSDSQVGAMTSDELMEKARQQMAALAKMEGTGSSVGKTGVSNTSSNTNRNQKIKIEWKKKK